MGIAGPADALARSRPAAVLDGLETVLRDGKEVADLRSLMGERGVNGFMEKLALDAGDGTLVEAILRPRHAQAAQERMQWGLARAIGADHLYPAAQMSAAGDAIVELVPGVTAEAAGVHGPGDVTAVIRRGYERDFPGMDPAEIERLTRLDMEIPQVLDNIVANHDRVLGNVMVDAPAGRVRFIDMGWMGFSEQPSKLRPMYSQEIFGSGASLELHPDTVRLVRERLTPDVIRRLHAQLVSDIARAKPSLGLSAKQRAIYATSKRLVTSPSYLERMLARREAIVANGRLETTPVGPAGVAKSVVGAVGRAYGRELAIGGTAAAAGTVGGVAYLRRD